MTTYYLAAAYNRRHEMCLNAEHLKREVRDARVTSRWHYEYPDVSHTPESLMVALRDDRASFIPLVQMDLRDIADAEVLVAFSGGGTTGGRHVELGVALALNMRIVLIGSPENAFYTLPEVTWFTTFGTFVASERRMRYGAPA